MKQKYYSYFAKSSARVRIELNITFESDNEISEILRNENREFLDESENDTIKILTKHKNICYYDYAHFLGNLLACNDPFAYLEKMFVGVSEFPLYFFRYQVSCAEKDYKEYISYNDFTLDFFDIYTNSKRITINRQLLDINYRPLQINSDTPEIIYGYQSDNITDIIFSTIHFALKNGYKFTQCAHCGKWFFKSGGREGSRTKYCKRNSPFKGYEHLQCEQAVRNITQQCARIKKRIRNKIENYGDVQRFQEKYKSYQEKIKDEPTVENLSEYLKFLQDEEKGDYKQWLT